MEWNGEVEAEMVANSCERARCFRERAPRPRSAYTAGSTSADRDQGIRRLRISHVYVFSFFFFYLANQGSVFIGKIFLTKVRSQS